MPEPQYVERTVVHDLVQWRTAIPGTVPPQYDFHRAFQGETITLPLHEADRLEDLGGITGPEYAAEAIAEQEAATEAFIPGPEGDEALTRMSAVDVIAYVTQHPDEAERVSRLERERAKGPRTTVLKAAGVDPDELEILEGSGAQ